ncbi:MAG TPA: GreA/GreB family elongation factor [Kofleriaceae bacterium]|nr:GreA/GreB family elongation factor [Kofleriaceae bacterium]
MSKAFTKEDDAAPAAPTRRRGVPVPEPNYMTPAGAHAARAEAATCRDADRLRELTDHLATAQVVEPPADRGEASLGAAVTVQDESGHRTVYRLVGALEADARRGLVFWQSPIGERLYGARVGDALDLPRGEVEVIAIAYD